jgi:glycosyltransferase involved in cell wall biosynthesis
VPPVGGVHWVPLWGDLSLEPWDDGEENPLRTERGWQPDKLVLMYSGNMGLGHRFEELLTAAAELQHDSEVQLTFAGGGKRRAQVEEFVRENPRANIELLPYAPLEKLRDHLCSADVLLASLDETWQGCMVPSKIQGIFAVGKPVIFVGAADNCLAHWISESGAGWVVPPDDHEALQQAIAEARDPQERSRRGRLARRYAEEHFHVQTNCARIAELLEVAVATF